jgi:hypothetical protein
MDTKVLKYRLDVAARGMGRNFEPRCYLIAGTTFDQKLKRSLLAL